MLNSLTQILNHRTSIPNPRIPIPNPHTPILNPHTPIPNPRNLIPNPYTLILSPRTPILNPHTQIPNRRHSRYTRQAALLRKALIADKKKTLLKVDFVSTPTALALAVRMRIGINRLIQVFRCKFSFLKVIA